MRVTTERRPLSYYLGLHYPVTVYEDPDGGYVAEIQDLPGCLTQAETPAELFEMIEDARRGWVKIAYEQGEEIPVPRTESDYSGKFVVRAPASLHRKLANAAVRESTSLNQYVVQLLSGKVDIDLVWSRLNYIDQAMARVERAVNYQVCYQQGPVHSASKWPTIITSGMSGRRQTLQAVAS